ncbi:MAG TPA: hypothetical protein VFI91_10275 [Longimicrobiaceae bacterium]|nr:hypothetical protein [Longimicrobiaceae bacterium]
MFWLILSVLAIIAAAVIGLRRRRYTGMEDEPWRASLGDDEPLDMDEIRKAEEEWNDWDSDEDEPWTP